MFLRWDSTKLDCKAYKLASPPELTGPLSVNRALENVEYILKDKIQGPESVIVEGDVVYTGLHDGRLVKIEKGEITRIIRFKSEIGDGSYGAESQCGRPLGIRRYNDEKFVVADAYLGLYLVNFHNGAFRQILDSRTPIDGKRPRFLNDLDVLNEDEIIFSDSSFKWERRDAAQAAMEMAGDGRVVHYKLSTGKATVLLNGLNLANGIQIMPDRESFLVAESSMAQIRRHFISGPKRGTTEMFAENLPGMPDNIRMSQTGTIWIGMVGVRHATKPSAIDKFQNRPRLRQFLLDILPSRAWSRLAPLFKDSHAMIIEMDVQGNIVSSLHDPTGKFLNDISEVCDSGEYLYLGSAQSGYLARWKKTDI